MMTDIVIVGDVNPTNKISQMSIIPGTIAVKSAVYSLYTPSY
jgi:hypothetical protein